MGHCRFSGIASAWGEFYEVTGDLRLGLAPQGWRQVAEHVVGGRHFLFYFRDESFECEADDWALLDDTLLKTEDLATG